MPANRPNLTLDQQFFQELLSAAYTIQEHNDRMDETQPVQAALETLLQEQSNVVCAKCGASRPPGQPQCERCAQEPLRPGERMQHNWASMWLMSQEQGLWPERSTEPGAPAAKKIPTLEVKRAPRPTASGDFADTGILAAPAEGEPAGKGFAPQGIETDRHFLQHSLFPSEFPSEDDRAEDNPVAYRAEDLGSHHGNGNGNGNGHSSSGASVLETAEFESNWALEPSRPGLDEHGLSEDLASEHSETSEPPFHRFETDGAVPAELSSGDFNSNGATNEAREEFADEALQERAPGSGDTSPWQRLADLRVKLRFHRADLYLGAAIIVAALALLWPVAGSTQQTSLNGWQRALVTLGIAEAPAPATHLQGDPAVEVWIDTHTALYYCPGEEQYGKTAGGRFDSQREAQTDRFEPAGRSACE